MVRFAKRVQKALYANMGLAMGRSILLSVGAWPAQPHGFGT